MRRHFVVLAAFLVCGAPVALAQQAPSVTWLAEDLDLPLRDGTAVDFAFQYDTHLADGTDPEGDATLAIRLCENHRCTTQALPAVEGTSFLRYGLDPTQYHRGQNLFTLTLTLTDNGLTSSDTLTIQSRVTP